MWPPWIGYVSADGSNLLAPKHLTDNKRMGQDGGSTSRKLHITSYATLLRTTVGFLLPNRTCKLSFGPLNRGAAWKIKKKPNVSVNFISSFLSKLKLIYENIIYGRLWSV